MSEIDHHLRSQVNNLRAEVGQLTGLVADATRSLHTDISQVSGQVETVQDQQNHTRTELTRLRDEFLAFVETSRRTSNVQQAATDIVAIEANLEQQFGHYKEVRRTAVGMLQAFDSGLVAEETVRAVSEEIMIQTPRYWLAPALVGLAAWAANDREVCSRALEEAFKRSPERTSLFMALVLRRQLRRESSVRWLRHYLRAQDPEQLGREFAVILEATSQGAFGPGGRDLVQKTLTRWRAQAFGEEIDQRQRWYQAVAAHQGAAVQDSFPTLARLSPQWQDLERALQAAWANPGLVGHYRALLKADISVSASMEDAVDDILDRLVGEYDSEELPLRRELRYQQQVRKHNGDLDAARSAADAESVALEETIDYLTLQSTAALDPEGIGVSKATQRTALAACAPLLSDAHARYCRDYRSSLPTQVSVSLSSRSDIEGHRFAVPTWKRTLDQDLGRLENDLKRHWAKNTDEFLSELAYDAKAGVIVMVMVCVPLFLLLLAIMGGFGALVAAVVAAVWGFVIHRRREESLALQARARKVIENRRDKALDELGRAHHELVEYRAAYDKADSQENDVRNVIEELVRAGQGGTGFEGRTVTT